MSVRPSAAPGRGFPARAGAGVGRSMALKALPGLDVPLVTGAAAAVAVSGQVVRPSVRPCPRELSAVRAAAAGKEPARPPRVPPLPGTVAAERTRAGLVATSGSLPGREGRAASCGRRWPRGGSHLGASDHGPPPSLSEAGPVRSARAGPRAGPDSGCAAAAPSARACAGCSVRPGPCARPPELGTAALGQPRGICAFAAEGQVTRERLPRGYFGSIFPSRGSS